MRFSIIFAAALAASPAMAGQEKADCQFATECYQDEVCVETDYAVTFARNTPVDPVWQMSDVAGVKAAYVAQPGGGSTTLVQAEVQQGAHLMMIGADGAARYAVLMFEPPQIITYHGICGDFE